MKKKPPVKTVIMTDEMARKMIAIENTKTAIETVLTQVIQHQARVEDASREWWTDAAKRFGLDTKIKYTANSLTMEIKEVPEEKP